MRFDPRQNLFRLDRLGDVIHRPQFQPFHLVNRLRERGHEHDRNIAGALVRFQPPARLKAVNARHHDIEQNQIRPFDFDQAQARFAV